MHVTGKLFYNLTRQVSDMCFQAESRIFSCHRINNSRCLLLLRTVHSNSSPRQLYTNRFVKCVALNRILSVNRSYVLKPTTLTGSSWTWSINRTKPPLVDLGNDVCGLYARELYTTSVFENKDRTPQSADISTKGLQEVESSDPSKGWREDVILTIPNALTISRILLAPVLGYMVLQQYYMLACGMFAYAGITDLLDGYIARRYPSQASSFGSYLDPLADKLLVSTLFISLTAVHLIPVVLTTLVIIRDVLLIGAAFYVRYISLPPPKTFRRYFDVTHATAQLQPTFVSKFNTVVQLSLVAATLAAPVLNYVDSVALIYLWYLTAGTTVASGLSYIFAKNTFRILRETKKQRKATLKKSRQG